MEGIFWPVFAAVRRGRGVVGALPRSLNNRPPAVRFCPPGDAKRRGQKEKKMAEEAASITSAHGGSL